MANPLCAEDGQAGTNSRRKAVQPWGVRASSANFERSIISTRATGASPTAPNPTGQKPTVPDALPQHGVPSSQTTTDASAASESLTLILTSLDDDKAEDVLSIDLRGKSSIADFMVIASGRSKRHVVAMADKLIERLKPLSGEKPRAEGLEQGDWALIDGGDVVVHIFRPEVREFYALEKMWAPTEAFKSAQKVAKPVASGG